jgi:hypothetical protein
MSRWVRVVVTLHDDEIAEGAEETEAWQGNLSRADPERDVREALQATMRLLHRASGGMADRVRARDAQN